MPRATASVEVVQEHATAAAVLILVDLAAREPPLKDVQGIQTSLERPVRATAESPIAVLVLVVSPVASGRVLVLVLVPVVTFVFVSLIRVRVIARAAVTTTLRARADADDGGHHRRQRDRPTLRPNLHVPTFFARHRDLLDDH